MWRINGASGAFTLAIQTLAVSVTFLPTGATAWKAFCLHNLLYILL